MGNVAAWMHEAPDAPIAGTGTWRTFVAAQLARKHPQATEERKGASGGSIDVTWYETELDQLNQHDNTPDTAVDMEQLRQKNTSFFWFLTFFHEENNAAWWLQQFTAQRVLSLAKIGANGYKESAATAILRTAWNDSTSVNTKIAAVALHVPWPPPDVDFRQGKAVTFYDVGKPFDYLGNFPAYPFTLDGIRYPNSETAFQCLKFMLANKGPDRQKQSDYVYRAGTERGGRGAFDAARELSASVDHKVWTVIKNWVMLRVVVQKFWDNGDLRRRLLAEVGENDAIAEVTTNDNYWAIPMQEFQPGMYNVGRSGDGNWLGRTHTWVGWFLRHLPSNRE